MANDILNLLEMNYDEACKFLQKKYGIPNKNYFANSKCKSRTKISRTNEGLCIHHIDEDKAIMLSVPKYALNNPWDYQLKHRLVYCNYLEHLVLHLLIVENPSPNKNQYESVGIGGCVNFLIPELNDMFNNIGWDKDWRLNVKKAVINYKKEFELIKKRLSKTEMFSEYIQFYYSNLDWEEAKSKILNWSAKEILTK